MFLKNQKIKVNVSELVLYLLCPRKVYYSCRGHETFPISTFSHIEHLILKEVGLNYSDLLKTCSSKDDDILVYLETMLSGINEELAIIYPEELAGISSDVTEEAISRVRSCFSEISQNLSYFIDDETADELRNQLIFSEPGCLFHSEKLAFSGIPGCVIDIGGTLSPLIIKTGRCPEKGVWKNDRLHIASLAILMEESGDNPVRSGIVVYARHGNIRNVSVRPDDRRQVLKILGRVRKIKDGSLPDRKESSLCDDCTYLEMCKVRSSLASKFF
ncbi:Dna2/Cas4 domain-containing protein [Methanolobus sp. ZRKC2]|uniref:CRISPR-associated protein Cas4 n=1 Tax=Methanolobus sp. ZRKC2 TaxID=3125783 RepID=UPI0032537321